MNENAIPGGAASSAITGQPASAMTPGHAQSAAMGDHVAPAMTPDRAGASQGQGASAGAAAASILAAICFDSNGLVPAIAQQHDTGEVLMMAWMTAEAVQETLATGRVCYFSRSRGKLWRKGETSGQTQHLKEMRVDCDGDTLLLLVHQDGVACHTGRRNCFFRAAQDGQLVEIAAPLVSPEALYGHSHG